MMMLHRHGLLLFGLHVLALTIVESHPNIDVFRHERGDPADASHGSLRRSAFDNA